MASESEFKTWVKDFTSVDKEIKNAGKELSGLRTRRKELMEAMLVWMQKNNVPRVNLADGETMLERNVKTVLKAVNAELITAVLLEQFEGNEEHAAALVSQIYDSRPSEDVEFLKVGPVSKKRRLVRPVDE